MNRRYGSGSSGTGPNPAVRRLGSTLLRRSSASPSSRSVGSTPASGSLAVISS